MAPTDAHELHAQELHAQELHAQELHARELHAQELHAKESEYWNGDAGQRWVRNQARVDAVLAPVAAAAIERANVSRGDKVVDIGCGCGVTSVELGRRVGPDGAVLGLDVSAPMLERARRRLPADLHVDFVHDDAATHKFVPRAHDLLFSRFGVMFFGEPAAAFANMRRALRRGGRVVFACWRDRQDNPWLIVPLQAAYEHVPPLPQPGPEDPGPFSFASEARVRRILGEPVLPMFPWSGSTFISIWPTRAASMPR